MGAALEPKLTIGGGLPAGIRVGLGIVGNLVGRLSCQLQRCVVCALVGLANDLFSRKVRLFYGAPLRRLTQGQKQQPTKK